MKEGDVCFTKIEIEDNEVDQENEDDQVAVIVSDSEEEKNKQRILRKEKKDAIHLTNICFSIIGLRGSSLKPRSSASIESSATEPFATMLGSFAASRFSTVGSFNTIYGSSISLTSVPTTKSSNTMSGLSTSFLSTLFLFARAIWFSNAVPGSSNTGSPGIIPRSSDTRFSNTMLGSSGIGSSGTMLGFSAARSFSTMPSLSAFFCLLYSYL